MKNTVLAIIRKSIVPLLFIGIGISIRMHSHSKDVFWTYLGVAFTAVFVLRIVVRMRKRVRQIRSKAGGDTSVNGLTTATLPDWLLGYYSTEKIILSQFGKVVRHKPLRATGQFSTANAGTNTAVTLVGATLITLLMIALGMALIGLLSSNFGKTLTTVILVLANIYLIAWCVGDLRSLRETGHTVTAEKIDLNLGIRCSGRVLLRDLATCIPLDGSISYLKENNIRTADVWMVTPTGRPNVMLQLKHRTALHIVRFGYPAVKDVNYIALYVDDPASFIDAVDHVLPAEACA